MPEPSGIRIGDAERDQAVSALAEHFSAGRLNKAEYDERADQVLQARYHSDLDPLFADLPKPLPDTGLMKPPATAVTAAASPRRSPLMMLFPMLMIGMIVTALILHAPWLLFGVFWLFMMGGFGYRRHWRHPGHEHWQERQRLWQERQQQWQQQQQHQQRADWEHWQQHRHDRQDYR